MRGPDGLDAGNDRNDRNDRGDEGRLTQSGVPHLDGGGPDFARMIEALRLVQERITAASPPDEVVAETAGVLEKLTATLGPNEVDESRQIAGRRMDLPGRGQALAPVLAIDDWDEQHVRARVTLGRFYLGAGGAAHGGVLSVVFDEMLGRLANTGRPGPAPPTCTSTTGTSPPSAPSCGCRRTWTGWRAASGS